MLELRARRPHWGARKLLVLLRREHPRAKLPSQRSIERLLRQAGCTGRQRVRSRQGPQVESQGYVEALAPNAVWTVDFKGSFAMGKRQRCAPLTVRDLYSRYVLCAGRSCSERGAGAPQTRRVISSAWAAQSDPGRQWFAVWIWMPHQSLGQQVRAGKDRPPFSL